MGAGRGGLCVRARRGRRRPRDSRRARARRHHRARAFPLPGRRREGAAARGAPGLRPQGHREALRVDAAAEGHRLAGRVSGDSTVAYAWAYAQALEAIAAARVPPRALWLRALALERERIANHLGDLGYLGNDGGFAFGLAQFSRLKEDVLRTNLAAFGHRLAMDYVVPGGVARDSRRSARRRDRATNASTLEREIRALRDIYDEHAGLQDRFRSCGMRDARARGEARPARDSRAARAARGATCAASFRPRRTMRSRCASACGTDGDVAARVAVRFDELARVAAPHAGDRRRDARRATCASELPEPPAYRLGLGLRRRLARTGVGGARSAGRTADPPLPSARSVVAELASAGARGDRQHRSGLSADQQVVQPFVQRPRPLGRMLHILRQIARTGIKTEPPPAPADEHVDRRAAAGRHPAHARPRARRSATSTPARATAASSRSTRSAIRTTTSKGSASSSSRARAMRTCCW